MIIIIFLKRVVHRKLLIPNQLEEAIHSKFAKFFKQSIGLPYKLNVGKILFKKSKDDGYFCSELAASAYIKAGILSGQAAGYWPGSFSNESTLNMLQDCKLDKQQTIVLERDKNTFQNDLNKIQ